MTEEETPALQAPIRYRAVGYVEEVIAECGQRQELLVRVNRERRHAVNFLELCPPVAVHNWVILNTTAVELGLGSGGDDFVIEVIGKSLPPQTPPGHIMKLRYTPLQIPILAAAAPESPYHEALLRFESLEDLPVVCAELHSQVAAVAAAAKWETGGSARIGYVMSDGSALPLAVSRLIPNLRSSGLIDFVITAGQAFGGDYEAVNLYSALAISKVVGKADIVIVAQGPGSVGTATDLDFSGAEQAIALNATISLAGCPIAVVRASGSDPRARHHFLSHHTLTVLGRLMLGSCFVAFPKMNNEVGDIFRAVVDAHPEMERHGLIWIDAELGLEALIQSGISVTTMGRSIQEDRLFFLSAAAAGLLAGQIATDHRMELSLE